MPDRFPIPPIPADAEVFRSDDLDEVREATERWAQQSARVVHGRGALGFELASCLGADLALTWGGSALPQTVRGAVNVPAIHLSVPPGTEYRVGRRRFTTAGEGAVLLPAGVEFTRVAPPGWIFAVGPISGRLGAELRARVPRPAGLGSLELASTLAPPELQAAIGRYLHTRVGTAAELPVKSLEHAEAELIGTLATWLVRQHDGAGQGAVARVRVAQVAAWIDANLDEAISIGRLCEVAGVGDRALQKSFERWRGMSPMRFVAERRLEAARRLLSSGAPDADVTRVALNLGFLHVGRFAKAYRELFGEAPSETRRRAHGG